MKDVRSNGNEDDDKSQHRGEKDADVDGGAVPGLRGGLGDAEEVNEESRDVAKDKHTVGDGNPRCVWKNSG